MVPIGARKKPSILSPDTVLTPHQLLGRMDNDDKEVQARQGRVAGRQGENRRVAGPRGREWTSVALVGGLGEDEMAFHPCCIVTYRFATKKVRRAMVVTLVSSTS